MYDKTGPGKSFQPVADMKHEVTCKLENFLTSEATYNESRPSPRNSQNIKYLTHNTTWQLQHLKFVRMDARL